MNKKVTKKPAAKKAVAKKVVKKAVKKPAKKKAVAKAKPATKKAKSIKTVQMLREGFKAGSKKNPLPHIKYLNCAISDVSNEKFPEMVQITMGPAKIMDDLANRRYVNLEYAKIAIDEVHGFNIVAKGLTKVADELADLGIAAVEVVDRNPFNALLVTK
jgi:hypothetical protein